MKFYPIKKVWSFFATCDFSYKKNIFLWNIVLGLIAVLGLPPFNFMPACFLSFGLFVCILDRLYAIQSWNKYQKMAAFTLAGWSFGFGYFSGGLFWIGNALALMSNASFWLIPLLILLLTAGLAIFWGACGFFAFLLWRNDFSRFFALAICFGGIEWLRGHILSGFPWNSVGYNLMPNSLFMQSAGLIGLYGMNFFAVLLFSLTACLFTKQQIKIALSLMISLFVVHLSIGCYYLYQANHQIQSAHLKEDGTPYIVRLLQPSIKPEEKFSPDKLHHNLITQIELAKQPSLIKGAQPDLIIWPETAIPFILAYHPEITQQITNALLPKQIALLGTVRVSGYELNKKFYNSLEGFDHYGNRVAVSDKVHLVPFGEYIPFKDFLKKIGLSFIVDQAGEYNAASKHRTVHLENGLTYLPLICYEIIFPTEINYEGPAPQFIVNVTNDMWYGVSPGPYQHLQQARVRAVEQRLPVLRAANNGISAVIDPYGRLTASLSLNKLGIIDAILPTEKINVKRFLPGNMMFLCIFLSFVFCYILIRYRKTKPLKEHF